MRLIGFAASKTVEVRYGVVFFVTFVGVGGEQATVPVEFRVVPDELDSTGTPLLSAGTVGPEGLDITTTSRHHVIGRLGVQCARAELCKVNSSSQPLCTAVGGDGGLEENLVVLRSVVPDTVIEPGEEAWVPVGGRFPAPAAWWAQSLADSSSSGPRVVEGPLGVLNGEAEVLVLLRAAPDEALSVECGAAVAAARPASDEE